MKKVINKKRSSIVIERKKIGKRIRILSTITAICILMALVINAYAEEIPSNGEQTQEAPVEESIEQPKPNPEHTEPIEEEKKSEDLVEDTTVEDPQTEQEQQETPPPEPSADQPPQTTAPTEEIVLHPQEPGQPELEEERDLLLEEVGEVEEEQPEKVPMFPYGIKACGNNDTIKLSEERQKEIIDSLPKNLISSRINVVLRAYSLEGKVSYFWGGKSYALGWDEKWGNPAIVLSEGSKTSGQQRTYGLDCSGYVGWCFANAAQRSDIQDKIGIGTSTQWSHSLPIEKQQVAPGDLAFYAEPGTVAFNHVGIVVGKTKEGALLIAHCSSSANNVIISNEKDQKFRHFRRPDIYADPYCDLSMEVAS